MTNLEEQFDKLEKEINEVWHRIRTVIVKNEISQALKEVRRATNFWEHVNERAISEVSIKINSLKELGEYSVDLHDALVAAAIRMNILCAAIDKGET